MTEKELIARFYADTKQFTAAMEKLIGDTKKTENQVSGSAGKIGGAFNSIWAQMSLGTLAANGIMAAFNGVVGFMQDSTKEFYKAEEANAQLEARLKSTGGAAGLTSDQLKRMAETMQETTTFEDDLVLSAENLMLTFTNVKGDVFEESIRLAADMSTALGQDLNASVMQLGKALQDPVAGANALRRVGVALTDQQKDQIKEFMKNNDVMSAQKVILKELATEFGGSAAAAVDTLSGKQKQFANQVGDVQEKIGRLKAQVQSFLIDVLKPGIEIVSDFFDELGGTGAVDTAREKTYRDIEKIRLQLEQAAKSAGKFGELQKKIFSETGIDIGKKYQDQIINPEAQSLADLEKVYGRHAKALDDLIATSPKAARSFVEMSRATAEVKVKTDAAVDAEKKAAEEARKLAEANQKLIATYGILTGQSLKEAQNQEKALLQISAAVAAGVVELSDQGLEKLQKDILSMADALGDKANPALRAMAAEMKNTVAAEVEAAKMTRVLADAEDYYGKMSDISIPVQLAANAIQEDSEKKKDNKKATEGWIEALSQAKSTLRGLIGVLGDLGIELSSADKKLLAAAESAVELASSIATGNVVGAVGAGISLIGNTVSAVKEMTSSIPMDTLKAAQNLDKMGAGSVELFKRFQELAKQLKSVSKAERQMLGEFIESASITSLDQMHAWERKVLDIVSAFDSGGVTVADAVKDLDNAFTAIIAKAQKFGTEGSRQLLMLFDAAKNSGIMSAEMEKYLAEQQEKALSGYRRMKEMASSDTIAKLRAEMEALNAEMVSGGGGDAKQWEQWEALNKKIQNATELSQIFGDVQIGIFDEMLATERKVAQNKDIIDMIQNMQDVMSGMSSTMALTNEQMDMFERSTKKAFDALIGKGFSTKEAMMQIAPTLAKMAFLAKEWGLALDPETQALIAQAQEMGIDLSKIKGVEELQKEATEIARKSLTAQESIGQSIQRGNQYLQAIWEAQTGEGGASGYGNSLVMSQGAGSVIHGTTTETTVGETRNYITVNASMSPVEFASMLDTVLTNNTGNVWRRINRGGNG